jgi:hypothetical protein
LPRPFSRLNREFDSELAQHSRPVKNGCGVRLPAYASPAGRSDCAERPASTGPPSRVCNAANGAKQRSLTMIEQARQ